MRAKIRELARAANRAKRHAEVAALDPARDLRKAYYEEDIAITRLQLACQGLNAGNYRDAMREVA